MIENRPNRRPLLPKTEEYKTRFGESFIDACPTLREDLDTITYVEDGQQKAALIFPDGRTSARISDLSNL